MTINPEDLQVDTFSSGLRQPQAVRITHRPTGTVASATHASRLQARETAMAELRRKLEGRETVRLKTLEGEEITVPVVRRNQMSIEVERAGRVFRYSADTRDADLIYEARFIGVVT